MEYQWIGGSPKIIVMTAIFVLVQGLHLINKQDISFPNIQSAIHPVPHGPEVPIPSPPDSLDDIHDDHEPLAQQGDSKEDSECYDPSTTDPIPFSQSELND